MNWRKKRAGWAAAMTLVATSATLSAVTLGAATPAAADEARASTMGGCYSSFTTGRYGDGGAYCETGGPGDRVRVIVLCNPWPFRSVAGPWVGVRQHSTATCPDGGGDRIISTSYETGTWT
jgi:hypothetical protein